MRIFENPQYKLIEKRKQAYIVSGLLVLASVVSLAVRGVTPGIDFLGGSEFIVETSTPLEVTDIRLQLADELGASPEVKYFGDQTTLLIRTTASGHVSEIENAIIQTISSRNPGSNPRIVKTDSVGPRFADDLKRGAILSVLFALVVIFIYIMVRFEWRFGVGAVVALAHDVIITLGLFSLLQGVVPFSLQIDQAIIAAFLTIVGYSLNDTVVVFDRIREYTSIFKTETFDVVVNRSINGTLSRTIVTSGTTLIVVVVLFLVGGEVLRGFAFALIVGIFVGTYSSVFVAAPVVLELRKRARK